MSESQNVAILIFDDVEVLDFSGPYEVFSVANRDVKPPPFNVFTVAQSGKVVARGGLTVQAKYLLQQCPTPDVLLIPGGVGINQLLENNAIINWVRVQAAKSRLITSVCTGALLLGRCGLLDEIDATTHHRCFDQLRDVSPSTNVVTNQRFVDTGRIITSAGISAGMDMSLHIVGRLLGKDKARAVAHRMEYKWAGDTTAKSEYRNELGQPIGFPLRDWAERPLPPRSPMIGRLCRLEILSQKNHAEALYNAFAADTGNRNWTYLPYGPFPTFDDFATWLRTNCVEDDPLFHTIVDGATDKPVGLASYLRIKPQVGVIEVGHIHYSPQLQRTPAATEAMYLMMSRVFEELGYRRYEWKCDALNQRSRNAAARLGFTFEGIFRQATIYKGRSRDTAWFSITDQHWHLKEAYQRWQRPENFDEQGLQKQRLQDMMQHEKAKR